MATAKVTPIRAMLGFKTASDADLLARATAVLNGLTSNAKFPSPPVDMATLKAAIDALVAAIAAALDGSKKAKAAKDKDRDALIKILRQLVMYVEANSDDDMSVFTTSGFQAATTTKAAPAPVAQPVVRRVEHGSNSGQLIVRLGKVSRAKSYDMRYAAMANGQPGQWTTESVTIVKTGILIGNLTPGTVYAFQTRALGVTGFTDWSDSVTMMCT